MKINDSPNGVSPRKRKKWDFDVTKCLVCSQPVGDKTSTPMEILQKIYGYVKERIEYGNTSIIDFWETICDVNLGDIISSGCVYHRTCYADIGNKTKRDRCKKRYEKYLKNKDASLTRRSSGRPTGESDTSSAEPNRMLRSQLSGYDRNACVICQRNDGVLHKVSTIPMGQKLFECVSLIQKKVAELRLNSVCNPADAVANDVLYHRKCYVYLKRQAWKDISSEFQDVDNKARVVADIEYKLS